MAGIGAHRGGAPDLGGEKQGIGRRGKGAPCGEDGPGRGHGKAQAAEMMLHFAPAEREGGIARGVEIAQGSARPSLRGGLVACDRLLLGNIIVVEIHASRGLSAANIRAPVGMQEDAPRRAGEGGQQHIGYLFARQHPSNTIRPGTRLSARRAPRNGYGTGFGGFKRRPANLMCELE